MRLLVEMFKLMDMPANCRLLFPRMLDRALDGGWKDTRHESGDTAHGIFSWAEQTQHVKLKSRNNRKNEIHSN